MGGIRKNDFKIKWNGKERNWNNIIATVAGMAGNDGGIAAAAAVAVIIIIIA